ncbi:MAG: hypothetical protein LBF41_02685 [Deltaproteobacteria bacterium]|jgi:hypothetical protein|nr:hypothetical protein [Deltaproteobacteria bacterium]
MDKSQGPENGANHPQTFDFFGEDERSQELNDFVRGLTELLSGHVGRFPREAALDAVKVLLKHHAAFDSECSDPNETMTIAKLEDMISEMKRGFEEINLKVFAENVGRLEKDGAIIAKKKKEFREKGIRLRVYQKYPATVMTAVGPLKYRRTALRPSFDEDKRLLEENGVRGYVFPLDDALGLSGLPFGMTVEAMLAVAKEATLRESYEDAERFLKETTPVAINDDTVRMVTNLIGSLVRANDARVAAEAWDKFKGGLLAFPEVKKAHTLYLRCGGTMVAARPGKEDAAEERPRKRGREREDDGKGVIWKECEWGLAFSTENVVFRTDGRGHRVTKKEYAASMGSRDEFFKLMLSLALRNGHGSCENTVLISDGSAWIRDMRETCFPDAASILDFHCLSERVRAYAEEIFNHDEIKRAKWADDLTRLFGSGKFEEAVETVKRLPERERAKAKFDLSRYLDDNKNDMDYSSLAKQGYFIGLGAPESGDGIAPSRRVKRGGTRWNVESARAVLSLAAKLESGLWNSGVADPVYVRYAGAPAAAVKQRRPRRSETN